MTWDMLKRLISSPAVAPTADRLGGRVVHRLCTGCHSFQRDRSPTIRQTWSGGTSTIVLAALRTVVVIAANPAANVPSVSNTKLNQGARAPCDFPSLSDLSLS